MTVPQLDRLRAIARSWLVRAAQARPGPRLRRRLSLVAAGLFVGASLVAWLHMPEADLQPRWLAAVATLAGLMVGANVLELRFTGRLADQRISWRRCLTLVLWGSATNLLPLPGSFLVRTHALAGGRLGWTGSARATLVPGIAWLGCASFLSGAGLLLLGAPVLAALLLAGGGIVLVGLWGLLPAGGRSARWMGRLLLLESVFVMLSTGRLLAALAVLGVAAEPAQALVLSAAPAWASAAGIFPGGVGLRELLTGGLAPLIGISAASGVVAAALDRVIGFVVLAGLSAVAGLFAGRSDGPTVAS